MNLWFQAMREEAWEVWQRFDQKLVLPASIGVILWIVASVYSQRVSGVASGWLILLVPGTVVVWHLCDTVALFLWARRQANP